MDLLTIALIFLIALLTIFLTVTGVQVFFILRDLKKALDRLNKVLETSEDIAQDIEKPLSTASNLVTTLGRGAKALAGKMKRNPNPRPRRFYKKTL